MAVELKHYKVHYVTTKGKNRVYDCRHALCIDGAEVACELDCKNFDHIDYVEEVAKK